MSGEKRQVNTVLIDAQVSEANRLPSNCQGDRSRE